MSYDLVVEIVQLIKLYEKEEPNVNASVSSFGQWLTKHLEKQELSQDNEPEWSGKENGRSADSVINTTLVHLYRYARLQAKAAIVNSPFSTPDEFIYLICLSSMGSMTKTALFKLNVHEKSAGVQIINRLIASNFIIQTTAEQDKRNKILQISSLGLEVLQNSMDKIREASRNVTEPLSMQEKIDLIKLLKKLEDFHEEKLLK